MLRFISSSRNSDLFATVASLSAASRLMRTDSETFLSVLGLPDPSRGPPRCRCTRFCSLFVMEC
jgi:hypothetical protein